MPQLDVASRAAARITERLQAAATAVRSSLPKAVPIEPCPAWATVGLTLGAQATAPEFAPPLERDAAPPVAEAAGPAAVGLTVAEAAGPAVVGLTVAADVPVAITVIPRVADAALDQASARKGAMIAMLQSPAVERVRSTTAQRIGDDGERLAALRLEALGWRIVARNLRVSRAEVDILAIDPSDPPSLVLVEVRRRGRRDFGLAEETVDFRKRNALRRAAGDLSVRRVLPDGRRLPELPVRVDLIAIDPGRDGRPSLRHHRGIDV